jgi:hypothetical protein
MSPSNKISQLALVAKYSKGYSEGMMYAGWTAGGVPALGNSTDDLTEQARRSLTATKALEIQLKSGAISNLATFDFNFIGPIFDFSDVSSISLTEDVIEIGLVDVAGQQTTLKYGELQLLSAIANGVLVWQFIPSSGVGDMVVRSSHNYSLVLKGKPGKVESDTLVIFKPILPDRGNKIEFTSFVRDVIGRLIALDEQQQPEYKKGYLEASSGEGDRSTIWDALIAPTADGKHFDPTKTLLKFAGKLGLIDIRGLDLEDKASLLSEGLNNTELPALVKIAKAMLMHASSRVK